MKERFAYTLLLLLLWGNSWQIMAQTPVSANITSNTTWTSAGSPYLVTDNIVVTANATLLIRQGVVVQFADSTGMLVQGNLNIEGGDSSHVLLTAASNNPVPGIWRGIRILGTLRALHVEGRYANVLFDFVSLAGLHTISGSLLAQNDTAVSFVGIGDSLQVIRSGFARNGVGISANGRTRITECNFGENQSGILGSGLDIRGGKFETNDFGAQISESFIVLAEFNDNLVGLSENNSFVLANRFNENGIGIGTRVGLLSNLYQNVLRTNDIGLMITSDAIGSSFANIHENVICDSWIRNAQNNAATQIDLSDNCWCLRDSASVAATIWDTFDSLAVGELVIMPLDTNCLPDLVFPGDANHNQVANVWDIFPIGANFGATGPPRPNATNQWIGQGATDWGDTLRNGWDIKHVDCNGDGVINGQDIIPIFMNYGRRHNSQRTSASGGYELYFDLPTGPLNPGDTLEMGVYLGTVDTPAVDVYGAAFSVVYDTSFIKPGSVVVVDDSSWLGQKDVDMLTAWYDSFPDGTVDLAFVRIDQMDRTGYGKLADISVVLDDDIAKTFFALSFSFGIIEGVDAQLQPVPIQGISGEVVIEVTTSTESALLEEVRLFPNPTTGFMQISSEAVRLEQLSLFSPDGRILLQREIQAGQQIQLDLNNLSPGLYLVRIQTNKGNPQS